MVRCSAGRWLVLALVVLLRGVRCVPCPVFLPRLPGWRDQFLLSRCSLLTGAELTGNRCCTWLLLELYSYRATSTSDGAAGGDSPCGQLTSRSL